MAGLRDKGTGTDVRYKWDTYYCFNRRKEAKYVLHVQAKEDKEAKYVYMSKGRAAKNGAIHKKCFL